MVNQLKRLLDNLCIDYNQFAECIYITNDIKGRHAVIQDNDGLHIHGFGYFGIWDYSPEYIAKMLDRKFKEDSL